MEIQLGGKRFIKETVDQVEKLFDEATWTGNPYAAIDADGTIWKWDIGIQFFEYQLKNKLIKNDFGQANFLALKQNNPAEAFAKLASINAGKSSQELTVEIESFLRQQQVLVFASTIEVIQALLSRNIKVIVVSASLDCLVSLALSKINLKLEVIGMKSIVGTDSRLTKEVCTPLPFGVGKREILLKRFSVGPVFAMGNTIGDVAMIDSAQCVKLAVASIDEAKNTESHVLFEKEQALKKHAMSQGWLHHQF